ncbi:hypothetical protein BVC80_1119g4 [Macleaya cordata]|uniref:Retrotransposon Copia-like N-terminal domain-containing protein n=1 Tax=Macleaya cordata TaxID=56857 RepID=A0A200Q9D0_MACCD|nr:hypothetical protein BVC80_1119g4 [Macleaya cordata]
MSTTAASSSTSSSTVPTLNNVNHLISIKLDRSNYLLWQDKMSSILRSQKLFKYVDPTHPIPPTHITAPTTNERVPNPAFEEWQDVDQTILTWIHVTLTDPVHSQVLGIKTARDAWLALEKSFADQNNARVLQLKCQLQRIQRGNQTIADYLSQIKSIADSLAAADNRVSDMDLVLYVLHGLGPEYEPFYTAITTRPPLPTFNELYSLLLTQETRLQHLQQNHSEITQTTAFVAGSSSSPQQSRHSNQQRSQSSSSNGRGNRFYSHNARGGYQGRGGFHGRGGGRGGYQGRVL